MHDRYKDKVQFLAVYVREAHPIDGWAIPGNDKVGISFQQPKTLTGRVAVARKCSAALEINMPLLVDDVNDRVGHVYSGMPDRLYIIDRDGKVAYQGGRGPFGFKPGEMEQSLAMLLLEQELREPAPEGRLPVLPDDIAWKRLPAAKGATRPLPAWARMLAGVMPKTTARMIELDAMHRTGTRLDPKLRGLMRWAAAAENGCAASRAFAEGDLRDLGFRSREIIELKAGNERARNVNERAAMSFARKMMRAAHSVTDDEVKFLTGRFGEKQLVAMVALLAHAAFQDRMLLALDAPAEPAPPLLVKFAWPKKAKQGKDSSRQGTMASSGPVVALRPGATTRPIAPFTKGDDGWLSLGFMDLRKKLDEQRARPSRIRVPANDEVRKAVPAEHRMAKGSAVLWSRVCYGFQPELTDAWFDTVSTFQEEARQNRIFQNSIFWVVTRSLQCFY